MQLMASSISGNPFLFSHLQRSATITTNPESQAPTSEHSQLWQSFSSFTPSLYYLRLATQVKTAPARPVSLAVVLHGRQLPLSTTSRQKGVHLSDCDSTCPLHM